VQLKLGNDGDGTTKINLSWSGALPADSVLIYRAGWGNYPEYDDIGGGVPPTPAYPPGAPWTLAQKVVGASSVADEVPWPQRDFWYYVAFVKDACGNISAVSNKTTGTLNYHLGDVHNGYTNCLGNNLVNTSDISFLGANYGATLTGPPDRSPAWTWARPRTTRSTPARPRTTSSTSKTS